MVIIGGGIVGCSVAYHLAHRGVRDVLLLERRSLTSGTTWHAAGLVGQLRATQNLTRLAQYSTDLFATLEAETGQATGYVETGSLSVATDSERLEELERGASMARCFGLAVERVSRDRIEELWPHTRTDDVLGGVFLPGDATTSPVDTTRALALGARQRGVTILENVEVVGVKVRDGRVCGVETTEGTVDAEVVVNCGGMWGREIGLMAGVNVPLHAAEHFYVITEPIPGLAHPLPTWREPGACMYFKTEPGGCLLIGFFEPRAKPWGMQGIPKDFEFDQLPDDWEHLAPQLAAATERLPGLDQAGIRLFFNGPESFTPDNRYLLGEAPEVQNFFVAAGFNSIGIQSAGGAGKVLADWICDGRPPMDLWDVDVRRMMPFQGNAEYLERRCVEAPGLLYAMHWPFRQAETARGIAHSPLHGRMESARACFGELAGWERPNWFAPEGVEPRYEYSWGRQNWFEYSAAEHRAVRECVGLFDQSSFSKFLIEGPDAVRWLGKICANEIDVPAGRVVYTPWLNEQGGIEADLTVTRLAEDCFWVVSAPATRVRDLTWLRRHLESGTRVSLRDVTEDYGVLGVMGPRSRELLAKVCDADLTNEAFPFGTSQEIEISGVRVLALRITYVGELGWELYVPWEQSVTVYDALAQEGELLGLRLAGFHAMNSLRIEKGYRHWSHDVTPDDNPFEAGLGFAVAMEKPGGFIGHESLSRFDKHQLTRRLVGFALEDPEPLLYHDEPIWCEGELVGQIRSGMYGHTVGRSLGLGTVEVQGGVSAEWIRSGRFEIEIAGRRVTAKASLRPFYDPAGKRVRA